MGASQLVIIVLTLLFAHVCVGRYFGLFVDHLSVAYRCRFIINNDIRSIYTNEIHFLRFYDEAVNFRYVHEHSVDMEVDYRNAAPPDFDTGRFKRDMQGEKAVYTFLKRRIRFLFLVL